jgi:hypothetical protein
MKINQKKEEDRVAALALAEQHKCPPGTRLMGKIEQEEMIADLKLTQKDVET